MNLMWKDVHSCFDKSAFAISVNVFISYGHCTTMIDKIIKSFAKRSQNPKSEASNDSPLSGLFILPMPHVDRSLLIQLCFGPLKTCWKLIFLNMALQSTCNWGEPSRIGEVKKGSNISSVGGLVVGKQQSHCIVMGSAWPLTGLSLTIDSLSPWKMVVGRLICLWYGPIFRAEQLRLTTKERDLFHVFSRFLWGTSW